ncbi:MAG TPA: DUF6159 family protein [Candidatus Methanoperedens sp.]
MKESFEVLKKDKEIMLFPVISAIVTVLLFISFIIPIFYLDFDTLPRRLFAGEFGYLLIFIYYVLSYFIVIFFNTGLITCAHIRLNGGDPTFSDGLNNAWKHIGKIFIWALISATVGIILRAISDRSGTLGRIVAAIIGMAWSLLTFFVVPVLVLENTSVFESIKKSGYLFKRTWGENVIGQFSMGFIFFILGLIGIVPLGLLFITSSFNMIILVFALTVIYWVVLGIVSASLDGIFVAALYNYANTGKIPSAYSPEVIRGAFQPKNIPGNI